MKIDEVLQGSKWVLHKGTRYIYINDKNDDAVPPAKPKDTGNNNGVDDANKDGNSGGGQEGEDKHNKQKRKGMYGGKLSPKKIMCQRTLPLRKSKKVAEEAAKKAAEEAAKKAAEEAAAKKSDTPTPPEETKVDALTSCDCAAGHLCHSVDKVFI